MGQNFVYGPSQDACTLPVNNAYMKNPLAVTGVEIFSGYISYILGMKRMQIQNPISRILRDFSVH